MDRRNVKVMYALSFLQGMVFYAPVATLYRQARGLNLAQIAFVEGISLAVTLAMEFPWGVLADRIGYRSTMLVCNGLFFVSKLIFWKARSMPAFLLERVLLAVTLAGLSGVDQSILFLSSGEADSQRAFAVCEIAGTLGLLAASAALALRPEDYDLAGLMTVFSYGLALVLTFALREVRRPDAARPREKGAIRTMLRRLATDRRLGCLVLCAALSAETLHTVITFLNQPQYLRAGMDNRLIALVYIPVTLAGFAGLLSEPATKRLGAGRFGRALLLIAAGACALLAGTRSAILSIAAVLALQMCLSLFRPLMSQQQNLCVRTQDRATELSMNAVVIDGAGVFIAIMLGQAAERSVALGMGCAAALCAAALMCYAAATRAS